MKRLRFVFQGKPYLEEGGSPKTDWLSIRQSTEGFTRKYDSLKIARIYHFNQKTVEAVSKHVELRNLDFTSCAMTSEKSEIITNILQNLKKLEILKFSESSMHVRSSEELRMIKEAQMPNLKTVVLHNSSLKVSCKDFFELFKTLMFFFQFWLAFFKSYQLKTLKIRGFERLHKEPNQNLYSRYHIIEFRAMQKKIKELALCGIGFMDQTMFDKWVNEIYFPLKKLALTNPKWFFGPEENILKFFEKFVDTL